MTDAGWHSATVLNGDLKTGIEALKAAPGKQIVIYGSGKLGQSLTALGLIDEYHLAFAPVWLGVGTPLFKPGAPRLQLRLDSVNQLPNGVLYARYSPA
jgi:dihydrofolate reductase